MRFFTKLGRGLLAASTTLVGIQMACPVQAQYGGYPQAAQPQYTPPGSYAAQQPQGYAQPQQQTYARPQQQAYAQPQQGYAQAGYAPAQSYAPAQATTPTTGFVQTQPYTPYGVPHTARAFQNTAPSGNNLPLTPPVENVAPGVTQNESYPQPTPAPENYNPAVQSQPYPAPAQGYPAPAQGPGCNCQPNAYTQAASSGYESYPLSGGCNNGYGDCTGYSGYGCQPSGGKIHGMFAGCRAPGCGYWFGGAYGLFMDRDNSNKYPLVFAEPSMPAGSYPNTSDSIVLTTRDVDVGYQPGVELRLGRTFGCAPVDPCSCASCGPRWGLEGVYWTLFDDDATATYVDQVPTRTYTMMPMYGLEYNDGTGYMPVNSYWDHAPPSQPADDFTVTTARVRSSFEVQNLELNLLRLNLCGGGYGTGPCGGGCGAGGCGVDGCDVGCDSGACGGYGACAPRASRYSCTAVCGFRWLQFDEDFMFGVDYYETATPANAGYLNYWSTVENNLIGFQLGCNGMYRIGCKWGLHVNTLAGIYGNDIDVHQYMVSPTGQVRFIGTGENFDVHANKTDVSMLGELRLGASYQATCRCRLYGGWRVIGVSGIALATDQTPNAFLSNGQMSNYVNSNGSLILHGLQTGVEFNY